VNFVMKRCSLSSLLRKRLELTKRADDWVFRSRKIAEAAEKVIGPSRLYVFGSVIRGQKTGPSDVDILIVGDNLPKDGRSRGEVQAAIEEPTGLPLAHSFETYLATSNEAEVNPVYRRAMQSHISVGKE